MMEAVVVEGLIFGEICRCCMTSKPRMKPLFETNLHTMLSSVSGLQVNKNDGLPAQLCVPCVLQVRRAHCFKVQCEQTDTTLRTYVVETKFLESMDHEFTQLATKLRVKQEPGEGGRGANGDGDGDGDGENSDKADLNISYGCPHCPKSFELEKKLKRHMRIHVSQRPHACSECDMTFVEKSNLSKHMRKHTGELRNSVGRPHLCAECGKAFKYSTSLSRHKRLHANRNLFTCQICLKAYVEQQTLDIHMRTHTNERPFACASCDKSFAQKVNLDRHERTHTGEKPFSCDTCGNRFTQKSYLVIHKRIHTQEKPYACKDCPSTFISRNALLKHHRTPCAVRPYQCAYCKKSFRYKKCLRTHKRNHLLESPHVCKLCDARFVRAVKLAAHMKAKHADVPFVAGDDGANKIKQENCNDPFPGYSANTETRNQTDEQPDTEHSDYDGLSEEEEDEDEEEEIEIEDGSMFEEDDDNSAQVVHVMFEQGEGQEVFEIQEVTEQYMIETNAINEEPLLAIKIMNPEEDDSDIEQ